MATPLRMQKLALSIRGVLSSPATSMIARHAPNHAVSLLDRRVPNHAACRSFQGTPPLHEKFKRGWLYEFKMIFSKEAKAEREKKLKEDVNRGQFWELRELDDTGGKLFEADVGVLPAEKSVPFPSVDGFLLNGEKANTSDLLGGKVTLVTVCIRDMGRPMTDAWATLYRKEIGDQAGVQVVQLSFVEGSMYKIFKSSLLGALKSRTAEALHSGQIMAFTDSEPFRDAVGVKNRVVGYAFLVDPERRIRWRAVGYPLKVEVKLLQEAIASLSPASPGSPPRKRTAPKAKKI